MSVVHTLFVPYVVYTLYMLSGVHFFCFFFFKQKTAYEMRISDWSSDVCSSDLIRDAMAVTAQDLGAAGRDNSFGWGLVQAKAALDELDGAGTPPPGDEIGRASCRERVCQYV